LTCLTSHFFCGNQTYEIVFSAITVLTELSFLINSRHRLNTLKLMYNSDRKISNQLPRLNTALDYMEIYPNPKHTPIEYSCCLTIRVVEENSFHLSISLKSLDTLLLHITDTSQTNYICMLPLINFTLLSSVSYINKNIYLVIYL
jgi:hypothetical protein